MCYYLQGLKEEIDSRLSKVQEIRFEPRLLSEEDDRLRRGSQISESPFSSSSCLFEVYTFSNITVCILKVATTTCTEWKPWTPSETLVRDQVWCPNILILKVAHHHKSVFELHIMLNGFTKFLYVPQEFLCRRSVAAPAHLPVAASGTGWWSFATPTLWSRAAAARSLTACSRATTALATGPGCVWVLKRAQRVGIAVPRVIFCALSEF